MNTDAAHAQCDVPEEDPREAEARYEQPYAHHTTPPRFVCSSTPCWHLTLHYSKSTNKKNKRVSSDDAAAAEAAAVAADGDGDEDAGPEGTTTRRTRNTLTNILDNDAPDAANASDGDASYDSDEALHNNPRYPKRKRRISARYVVAITMAITCVL